MAKKAKAKKEEPEAKDAGAEAASKGIFGNRKLLILIGGGVLGLLLVAGGTAWALGLFKKAPPPVEEAGHGGAQAAGPPGAPAPPPAGPSFVDLPDMTVNLASREPRPQFLRLRIALEVADARQAAQITPVLPRVLDIFQTFLRELRSADLEGSAGIHRLKEELTRRVNLAVQPARVDSVLFREILVQ